MRIVYYGDTSHSCLILLDGTLTKTMIEHAKLWSSLGSNDLNVRGLSMGAV